MNWKTITVEQYQEVYRIITDTAFDDFEKEVQVCALLADLTERQVEELTLDQYKELKGKLDFVFGTILAEQKRMNKWKGYTFILDVRKLDVGRYITLQHFLKGAEKDGGVLVKNLHNLAACLVIPDDGYDSAKHTDYAEELKDCPFLALYHTMVFFCNVYNLSIRTLLPYLEEEAKAKGATPSQISEAMTHLQKGLVGY